MVYRWWVAGMVLIVAGGVCLLIFGPWWPAAMMVAGLACESVAVITGRRRGP